MTFTKLKIGFGIFLFILANIMAFVFKTTFYVFFVLGLFLILRELYPLITKKSLFARNLFIITYLVFILLGLLGDFVMNTFIAQLWYYPEYNGYEFIMLYLLTYPLAGIVSVYIYSLLEYLIGPKRVKVSLPLRKAKILSWLLTVLGFASLLIFFNANYTYSPVLVFTANALFLLGLFNLLTLHANKVSILAKLLRHPLQYGIIVVSSSFLEAVITEYPNSFAQEWIYQNLPFMGISFANVPLIILLGWIILVLLPYSCFEMVKAINTKYLFRRHSYEA